MYGYFLSFNRDIRPPEMSQRSNDCNAAGINKGTIVVEKMYVSSNAPTLLTGYNAERFLVDSIGSPNRFFNEAGEENFLLC